MIHTTARAVALGSTSGSFDVPGGVTLELAGPISGPAYGSSGLYKYGAGTLTLSGTANPSQSTLWVREGVVLVTNPGAIQNVPADQVVITDCLLLSMTAM